MSIEMESENGQYHCRTRLRFQRKTACNSKPRRRGTRLRPSFHWSGQIDRVTVGYVANGLRSGVPYELAKRLAEAVPDEYPEAPIVN